MGEYELDSMNDDHEYDDDGFEALSDFSGSEEFGEDSLTNDFRLSKITIPTTVDQLGSLSSTSSSVLSSSSPLKSISPKKETINENNQAEITIDNDEDEEE